MLVRPSSEGYALRQYIVIAPPLKAASSLQSPGSWHSATALFISLLLYNGFAVKAGCKHDPLSIVKQEVSRELDVLPEDLDGTIAVAIKNGIH